MARRSRTVQVRKAASLDGMDTVRVGIYVRRSTDEDNQPYTMEAQTARLKAYEGSQPGWKIVKTFSDDASGANTNRPGLQKAMHWAKSGLIDVLLVYRVDRFSRNLRDTVNLLGELDKAGVAFRSATEPFDTSDPMGRMFVQLLAMFAQFERDVIVDRITAGMESKAKAGRWKGGTRPPGYNVDKETQKLYVNEAEAVTVRLIFDLYTKDRLGSRSIANEINERGHRTRAGGLWAFKRILTILENPVYIGEMHFREIVTKDAHPSIVSTAQYEEALRLLDQRADSHAHRAASGSDYMATGRLPCPRCGHAMIGTRATGKTKTYRYYTCLKRIKYGKDSCDMDRINADALDQALLTAVASFYGNQHSLIQDAVDAARQVYDSSHQGVTAELKVVRSEIVKATAKIDKYLDAFESDTFDPGDEAAKARLVRHRTTQRQLRDREAELQEDLENEPTMPDAATLDEVNQHITEIFRAGNHNQRKALVENFVVKIKITGPGRIVPVFRVPQAAEVTNTEGAETGLPASAPEGVRAMSYLVELRGIEPRTFSMRTRRATNCATAPRCRAREAYQ